MAMDPTAPIESLHLPLGFFCFTILKHHGCSQAFLGHKTNQIISVNINTNLTKLCLIIKQK